MTDETEPDITKPLRQRPDPGDRAMLWFNIIGISLAVGLLGTFFWLYGAGFLSLMIHVFAPDQVWPDR